MVENTSACNYECTGCDRSLVADNWKKRQMSLEEMERVALQIKALGIKQVAFFKLGEPFLSKHVKQELEILRRHNPEILIHTSTNGTLINTPEKLDAAMLMDHITFSIDGPDQ